MWDTAHQCRKKKKTVTVETVLVTFSLTTGSNSSAFFFKCNILCL